MLGSLFNEHTVHQCTMGNEAHWSGQCQLMLIARVHRVTRGDQESLHHCSRCARASADVSILSSQVSRSGWAGQGPAFTQPRLNNYKTIKTGQWDGGMGWKVWELCLAASGSMQNVRCSVRLWTRPSQAPGRSQRIIKSGHPRSHWREKLFVSQNVPWVRIPGSCWHTRNTWKRSTLLIQWWIHLAVMVTSTPGSYAVLIRFYGCCCFKFKVSINPPDLSVLLRGLLEISGNQWTFVLNMRQSGSEVISGLGHLKRIKMK